MDEWEEVVPPEGLRTVCEINCRLVHIETDGDPTAKPRGPTYPEIRLSSGGHNKFLEDYAPVITVDESAAEHVAAEYDQSPILQRIHSTSHGLLPPATSCWKDTVLEYLRAPMKMFMPKVSDVTEFESYNSRPPPFAWHSRHQVLAAADAADRVHVYNVGSSAPTLGSQQSVFPASLHPELVLYHEFQRQVGAVEWRPPCGNTVAVGCSKGICLWDLGTGPAGSSATQLGASGNAAWMTFLRSEGSAAITSLAWSPCGRLLASASVGSPGIDIWDVALGVGSHIQAGPGGVSLLRWSPCGRYLLSGGLDDSFIMWETSRWTSQPWLCEGSGRLVEAAWRADGQAVALAFSKSTQIVMLHFISPAPSLAAQMLPLDLPELRICPDPKNVEIHCMAWDPTGRRLAVVLKGDHPAADLIALYATSSSSIATAGFLGYLRLSATGVAGTNNNISLAFQGRFRQGALLAMRSGRGHIGMIPMYFSG